MKKQTVLALWFLAWASLADAATYYVNKSGTDANSCATAQSATDANAKLTITAGLTCLGAGDTLMIGNGTYAELFTNPLPSGASAAAPTTMECENTRLCIIQPSVGAGSNAILLNANRSNIKFKGLMIDGTNLSSAAERGGIRTNSANTITGLIIENNEIKNFYGPLIVIGNLTSGVKIQYNSLHTTLGSDLAFSHAGIYIRGPSGLIDHNEIYAIGEYPITANSGADCASLVISNNVIRDGSTLFAQDNGLRAINITCPSVTVYNNLIFGNGAHGINVTGWSGTRIYNNTIYGNGGRGLLINAGVTNIVAANNIIIGNTTAQITDSSGNLTSTTNRTTGVATDLMIDPANDNFNLKESSAAIDAGTVVSGFSAGRYVGSLPDQGALEACVRNRAVVENDEPTHYHVAYDCPIQSTRNLVALQTPTVANWAMVVAGGAATENSAAISGTTVVEVVLASAVTNGQSLTDAMTRSTAPTLTDSTCLGDPNGTCYNAQVRSHTAASGVNNVGAAPSHVVVQSHFRFHKLRGTEAAPALICATCTEDVASSTPPGAAFRLRVKFRSDDAIGSVYNLRYSKDGGAYTLIPDTFGADGIAWYGITADSDIAAAGTPTTEQLTSDEASNTACAVVRTSSDYPMILLNNSETECEYVLKKAATVPVGTTFDFRIYDGSGAAIDTYTTTARDTTGNYVMAW